MAHEPFDEKAVFNDARCLTSHEERAAYLRNACAANPYALGRIIDLLRVHDHEKNFMESPALVGATIDQPISECPGQVVGAFKLIEQIGEGGMGTVWLAQQTEPVRRLVALKLIKAGMDSKQVIARFDAERQALALMDHPNIAKVLDAGTTDAGRPYFVMDLVKGEPITTYCDEHRLTPRQRLELFVSVCQAVQHAHQKGIIHRDLKPTNVLVASYDGKPVPKVIDFGVAKAAGQPLTEQTLVTGFGAIVGTLEYMSPEQAELNQHDIDTRSDIYALGVLLYELLTATTPFAKERFKTVGYDEIRRIIREEEPPRPSTRLMESNDTLASISLQRQTEAAKLTKLVRGELDWIVMRCLEKDRNRRYESASALAADVQNYLNDEPVQACPPSVWYRVRKFARRKKALFTTVSVIAAALLLAVTTLGISGVLVWRANQDLLQTVYLHRIGLAHRELSADNLHGAIKFLEECPEHLRDWEWHYLMRLCRVEPMILQNKSEVNSLAFSPDGEKIAAAGGDGKIKIWNSFTNNVVQTIPAHKGAVVSVAFHRNGTHLASRGADGKLNVWDLTTGQAVFTAPCDSVRPFGSGYTVAFSVDGRLLAAGTVPDVMVWDWKKNQLFQTMPGHKFHTIPVAFSADGRLATGGFRDGPKLWDPQTGKLHCTADAPNDPVSSLAFSPDGKWLASATLGRTVKVFNSTTGRVRHSFDLHTGNVEAVAVSCTGKRIASGGEDKKVRVWDAISGREVLSLHGHTDRCACVAFSPDGLRLASASADGTIRIWDGTPLRGDEPPQEFLTFAEHTNELRSVAFGPDRLTAPRIASAGSDGVVKIWDALTGRQITEFGVHKKVNGKRGVIFCLAWHPNGHRIASTSIDTVRVWDVQNVEKEIYNLPTAPEIIDLPFQAMAFSPNGRYLVTGKVDGAVQVWDAETGAAVGQLDTHKHAVRVVFSKGGEYLATASSDGKVNLWDAKQLDKLRLNEELQPHRTFPARVAGPGLSVAFSPDGRRLATGGERNTIKVWDIETNKELLTLWGHKGDVYTLAFSPDDQGRWIASAGEDSTVKIWDSHTGELVRTFRGHRGVVSSLAFSPDGQLLASGSRDRTVKVWDVSGLDKQ